MKKTSTMAAFVALCATLAIPAIGRAQGTQDWSGAYLSLQGGGSSLTSNVSIVGSGKGYSAAPGAAIGGALAGYNWQKGTTIIGIEGEYGGVISSSPWSMLTYAPDPVMNTVSEGANFRLRARFGVINGPLLLFVAGGWSQSSIRLQLQSQAPFGGHVSDQTNSVGGYNAGAGLGYAVSSRAMLRIEYIYDHLGNTTFIPTDTFFSHRAFSGTQESTYRASLDFRL